MKKKPNLPIYLFIFAGAFFVLSGSCKKDDDNSNNNNIITGTLTDSRDGIVYKTVIIGSQVWMAENLKYLPDVSGPGTGSETSPHYYVYGYDGTSIESAKATANYTTYGVLYNWEAAKASCPAGWHLPGETEWKQLTDYLGGESVAGGKLKETGTSHWNSPNTGATNQFGFTALPGGNRVYTGSFGLIGDYGNWWSATAYNDYNAWNHHMYNNNPDVLKDGYNREEGYSVRCVKN